MINKLWNKKVISISFFALCIFMIFSSSIFFLNLASGEIYITDVYFTLPDTVFMVNERIELMGYVYQANYTDNGTWISNSTALANAKVNLTTLNTNGNLINTTNFTTDANGSFYSKSNYRTSSPEVLAPGTAGTYTLKAEYNDSNNETSFSEIEIIVVNGTVDTLRVSPDKANYNPSEEMTIEIEAIKMVGDRILHISDVFVEGSLRDSTKDLIIRSFDCTTQDNGKCSVTLDAPDDYGNYILELENFKTSNSFSVVPFSYNVYIKDELGASYKNIFAQGEQANVEVKINNVSSGTYTFSGHISDSSGNSIEAIDSITLDSDNSFTNSYLIDIDTDYSYETYSVHLTVAKLGDGSIDALASFQVQDWMLAVNKKETDSGFEYEYSGFADETVNFEAYPTYRTNGSLIPEIDSSSFSIALKDNLNNILASTNTTWNESCGSSGCYEFSFDLPSNIGQYTLYTTLSYKGDTQKETSRISVISGVMAAQSTDKDGNIKELFGTNEYIYLTLSAYNISQDFNLSDAEIFIVSYMNGSEFTYTEVASFDIVNMSNDEYEWAWDESLQRLKLDVPKVGGLYNIFIFAQNRSLGAETKFIVNPYDVCSATKNALTDSYYAWQFQKSDTVYFEITLTQANNPLGKATALNSSTNSSENGSYGIGGECNINTATKQVVDNATITIQEVRNLESGAIQNINTTESSCASSDNEGGYSCTLKPLTKWDGGVSIVKFSVEGQDGTVSMFYNRFEARAFYLYGWSTTWQNNPSSNITLNILMYEAGNAWWQGNGGTKKGSITVKRVEYQGRDGEWLWPPVDSGYNTSNISVSRIESYNGAQVTLPVLYAPEGEWKTGYYRVVLQATTDDGDTDYGYAWFGVKLWDVYGSPIECDETRCNYKSYFNSRENITMYVSISKAGDNWWYSNYNGGQDIYGNVTVGIKKIQDCRKWPCRELNSSEYDSTTINVNASSPGYWNANLENQSNYIILINTTTGTWGTGYYSVTLDVNGTDTGYAWFNTIAFYVETQPTNDNGSTYKYSIRGQNPMYFNVTTTKNYKWTSSGARYNASDYVNVTFDDAVLRTWDQETYKSKEYNYPEDINITPGYINGTGVLNFTFKNGSWDNGTWPNGYYWGEITLRNSENETSTGWLWFNVQPFRVSMSANSYNVDTDQCVNASLTVYESDWNSATPFYGNYSIIGVYENVWTGSRNTKEEYNNYTTDSFNATAYILVCPEDGDWGTGNWGGWHYLNIVVQDNELGDTQTGWLSFKAVPFQASWNNGISLGDKRTTANINTTVSLTKPSNNAASSGILTELYQWVYDNSGSRRETYTFRVGNATEGYCYSNVSDECVVGGKQNITIYAPEEGWKNGWNYIQAGWKTNAGIFVQDYNGVSFNAIESYVGWFQNSDTSGNWKADFADNEDLTIKVYVRDANSVAVDVNITNVQYAYSSMNCGGDWCRTYVDADYSPTNISDGEEIITITAPVDNWTKGNYYFKVMVEGDEGATTITGGNVRVKDFTPPEMTINVPINNQTYSNNLNFNANTSENAQCSISILDYNRFYAWHCNTINATNEGACNSTKYGYNSSTNYEEEIYNNWHAIYNTTGSTYPASYLNTGMKTHSYSLDISSWNNQSYGMRIWCYDMESNYAYAERAFKVNNSA